ncbi:MAG: two-component regulator propeller domain-containing protein [Bacteroidota bacterium]
MRAHRFLLLFLFQIISLLAIAQKHRLKFQHLTTEQGLSQSTVDCILQDSRGFIWVGTRDGLNKYDGYSFTVYKNNPKDPHSLSNNYIKDIIEDKQGNLWIATWDGGLERFDRQTEQFFHYTHDKNKPNSLSSNLVNNLLQDSQGYLWIATQDGGLDRFDPKTQHFTHFQHNPDNPHTLGDNFVREVMEDHQHNIWVATSRGGLNLLNRQTNTFTRYQHQDNNPASLTNNDIWAILEDRQHRFWVGTHGGGLDLFSPATGQFSHFKADPKNRASLAHNVVLSLGEDPEGNLWVGTENGGLSVLDAQTQTFHSYQHDEIDNTSLLNNSIYCIYPDAKGNMWVGTYSGGINLLNQDANLFTHYRHGSDANSLINNNVTSICEDWQGNIWIGTDGGGINQFNRKTGEFRHYQHQADNVNSIGGNYILNIREDSQHNLWIGTWGDGLTIFNPERQTYQHRKHDSSNPASVSGNNIWAIFEDSQQRVWVGPYFGTGLDLYDRKTGKFTHYRTDPKDPNSISSGIIYTIAEDRQGYLWIGTDGAGVDRFDPKKGTFTHYRHKHKQNSLSNNSVYCVYEDRQGDLWFGTNAGLNHLNRQTNVFTVYTTKEGLANDVVFGILADKNEELWLSTNNGLSRFNLQRKIFHNYTIADGLQSKEYRANAFCKSWSGMMYFGGNNGFNEFYPEDINEKTFEPPVVLTDFQIFNKRVPLGHDSHSILTKPISETKAITLSYKESVFSLAFASLNYTSPEKKEYSYQLEGFDKGWNNVGTQRTATYTNLDAGEYLFKVRGLDSQGRWSQQMASLKITITPAFWQTWWFIILLLLTILGSGVAFYRMRIKSINVQKAELEHQVKERTIEVVTQKEELQDQADILQSFIEEIKNKQEEAEKARQEAEEANRAKSTFLATMSHEIRTPMNGVLGMASLLAETNQSSEQREYTETILNCGESLLTVINDILDYSKIESGNMELEQQDFDLRTCIEEVFDVFASKAAELSLDLIYQIDSNVPAQVMGDGLRLRQVLLNLVSNAIKFTQQGEIFLGVHLRQSSEKQGLQLGFDVRDTGIGIPEDKIDRLFKAFSQVDSSTTRKYGGTGLGLVICEKLIGLMGGTIEVTSQLGQGTTFSFSIRVKASTEALRTYVHYNTDGLEGKRILVIDDNATNRLILQNQLQHWQLVPVLAESGSQALALLSQEANFDIVISDMQMPEMDGIQLARAIRNKYAQLPIILLSSMGMEQLHHYPELFCAVLTKPVKQHILCKHILNQLKQQDKAVGETEASERKLSEAFANQYPLRILIAEDNLVNQKLAVRILNKLGYQPGLASDGLQALEAVSGQEYDLVLMDVQMPVMDGLEATRIIRQKLALQPQIVAMTANAMQGDRETCLQAGMDNYLSKPIKLGELVAILEKCAQKVN